MSDRDDALDSLRHWEEWIQIGPDQYEKRKHQRRLLILDEKPKLIDNVSTDNTMWDNLLSDASLYTPSQYAEVEAAVDKVGTSITNRMSMTLSPQSMRNFIGARISSSLEGRLPGG
jgi:hypothetical protein